MATSLQAKIRDVLGRCHNYYRTNGDSASKTSTVYNHISTALTKILKVMAVVHEELYDDRGYTADAQHPGYLIKAHGSILFRVPYHVLPTFPTDRHLTAVWDLSQRIQSSSRSTIAISGSNVLRNLFEIVGDIDFCEYFQVADGFDRIVANLDGDNDMMCLKLAVSGPVWEWDAQRPTAEFLDGTINPALKDRSTFKMDYVGNVDHFGITEVSNVVIALDANRKSAGLAKTFAAQEVPLTPVDWLPNHMNDPIEMGRYIDWLARAIKSLQRTDTRKCMKRCASLSRILFLNDITDEIAELVEEHHPILLKHQLSQMQKLCATLGTSNDERWRELAGAANTQRRKISAELGTLGKIDRETSRRFNEEVNLIADGLLTRVRIDN
jgi:hypothetical protein